MDNIKKEFAGEKRMRKRFPENSIEFPLKKIISMEKDIL